MRRFATILAVTLLLASPCAAQYSVTTLDYPGATATRLIGLNDRFDVVGHYILPGGIRHAMLYSGGRFTPLDPAGVLGTNPSSALQINNRGDIVGWYTAGGVRHGFLLRNGVVTTIDYPGATNSQVNGISDTGVMIGQFRDSAGYWHGYELRDGVFTQLDYPGGTDTLPYYMDARGDIAGEWDPNPALVGHGFVLTRDGEWVSFDAPGAPANSTLAIGVNDHREVLGAYWDETGRMHTFVVNVRDVQDGPFTIVDLPGANPWPETINNANVFVGYYTQSGIVHGFVASPLPQNAR